MSYTRKRWTEEEKQKLVALEKTMRLSVLSGMFDRTENALKLKLCEIVCDTAIERKKTHAEILANYKTINNMDIMSYLEMPSAKKKYENNGDGTKIDNNIILTNKGKKWCKQEYTKLFETLKDNTKTLEDLAILHGRTITSIKYKLLEIAYNDINERKCSVEEAQKVVKFVSAIEIQNYVDKQNIKNTTIQPVETSPDIFYELIELRKEMNNKIQELTAEILALKKHTNFI